jgi:hypothetical protein
LPVAGLNSVDIFPLGSKPYGLTYAEHIKSSLICLDPDCVEPNFATDVKYNIIAE